MRGGIHHRKGKYAFSVSYNVRTISLRKYSNQNRGNSDLRAISVVGAAAAGGGSCEFESESGAGAAERGGRCSRSNSSEKSSSKKSMLYEAVLVGWGVFSVVFVVRACVGVGAVDEDEDEDEEGRTSVDVMVEKMVVVTVDDDTSTY